MPSVRSVVELETIRKSDPRRGGPLRVGLVGAGFISEYHAKAIRQSGGVVVGIADASVRRAEVMARGLGVKHASESVEEMIEAVGPEVVHVLTPPHTHAEIARRAIEAGVHVLLEKPMDVSPSACAEVAELARRRGVKLGVSHNFLFAEPYTRLREDVKSGRLGWIDRVRIVWEKELGVDAAGPFDAWMLRDPGNIMLEVGVHGVAHLLDLVGEPERMEVTATDPRVLPTGVTFFRRWSVRAWCGGTEVELDFSFGPGFTRHQVDVRGAFGVATADLADGSYTRELSTAWSMDFDRYFRLNRRGGDLRRQARGSLARYVLSKFGLSKRGNAFASSIAASVEAFYAEVKGEDDPRTGAALGARVVELAKQIGERGPAGVSRKASPGRAAAVKKQADVLVLGGTGFIGRELVKQLLEAGRRVRVLGRNVTALGSLVESERLDVMRGDARDAERLNEAMEGVSCVYHLARAQAKIWPEYLENDVEVTRRIGRGCVERKVKRLVYTGTIDSLYLGPGAGRIDERAGIDPRIDRRNYYARAKAMGERVLKDVAEREGLGVVIVRPGIVIGQGTSPCHWGVGMWNGLGVCRFWGAGENRLPLVLVEDVARALVSAGDRAGIEGRSYNLSGEPTLTAREYVEEVERCAGAELQKSAVPIWRYFAVDVAKWVVKKAVGHPDGARRPSYRDWSCRSQAAMFDCTAARRDLGWEPEGDRERLIQRGIVEPVKRVMSSSHLRKEIE